MSLGNFQVIDKLGDGTYSTVFKVCRIADSVMYALKKVPLSNLSTRERENALNEVRFLASLKNPNIIEYKEAFIDTPLQALCIVMEFADDGDLLQKIHEHQKNKTRFEEDEIWRMFVQAVRGLRALHELNIMHRDLKSANVFLFKDSRAKLGDLNVSKLMKQGLGHTQTGTPYYASPEVWNDRAYDIKSDIWSLGCVFYEAMALRPPFIAPDMHVLYERIVKGKYPKLPSCYSQELADVIRQLLQTAPQARPTCEEILKLPSVMKQIKRIFPRENFESLEKNLLMKTLRLSDSLPSPNYMTSRSRRDLKKHGKPKFLSPLVTTRNKKENMDNVYRKLNSNQVDANNKETLPPIPCEPLEDQVFSSVQQKSIGIRYTECMKQLILSKQTRFLSLKRIPIGALKYKRKKKWGLPLIRDSNAMAVIRSSPQPLIIPAILGQKLCDPLKAKPLSLKAETLPSAKVMSNVMITQEDN